MRVYLVQHGDAVPERLDPERPLSAVGRREVHAVARQIIKRFPPADVERIVALLRDRAWLHTPLGNPQARRRRGAVGASVVESRAQRTAEEAA